MREWLTSDISTSRKALCKIVDFKVFEENDIDGPWQGSISIRVRRSGVGAEAAAVRSDGAQRLFLPFLLLRYRPCGASLGLLDGIQV